MMKVLNPANGRVVAELATDDAASIADKMDAARAAQGSWFAKPLDHRLEVLRGFGEALEARADALAQTLTMEMGKPLAQARGEVLGTRGRLEFFLDCAANVLADNVVHQEEGLTEIIAREPLGVIANISAWNYPYFVGSNVFVPGLLAGNAILYKPSEHASMTGLAIADLLWEAGVPRDVFATVIGGGDVGAALVDAPVDGMFFTGSFGTGRAIAKALAGRLIPTQYELGGKDPVYVCEDVDVKSVAAAIADGAFYNTGQSCCSVERIYVHESVYEEFVEAFLGTVSGFVLGDPMADGTYIGPLTREPQLAVLAGQVADAVQKGASLRCGGRAIEGDGYYFQPTVLTEVTHDMTVMRQETFGPVIGIQAVSGDAEALARMNDTDYGLTSAVYTSDPARARRVLDGVNSGSVYWNCCDRVSPRLPWSGRGHSGLGLTLSQEGLTAFTRPKAYHLRG
jgi:acyl-CoA reductase-like NAD-dependent aldehyde dehydrogenase